MPSISSSSTLNPLTKEGRVSSSAGVENKKRLNWAAGSDRSIASSLYAFKPCHVALSPLRLFRAHCGQTQNSAGECELRMQNGHNATTQMETCQPWEPRLLSTLFLKRRYSVAFIAARLGAANDFHWRRGRPICRHAAELSRRPHHRSVAHRFSFLLS